MCIRRIHCIKALHQCPPVDTFGQRKTRVQKNFSSFLAPPCGSKVKYDLVEVVCPRVSTAYQVPTWQQVTSNERAGGDDCSGTDQVRLLVPGPG